MCPLLKKPGSLDHMCMNLLFCNKSFHCIHIDDIQKFCFSSNEKVSGGGSTWPASFGNYKKKKRKEQHDIAPSSFLLIPEGFNPLGIAKYKRKYLNSETAHSLTNSLALSQYLPSYRKLLPAYLLQVFAALRAGSDASQSQHIATCWIMFCKAEKSELV